MSTRTLAQRNHQRERHARAHRNQSGRQIDIRERIEKRSCHYAA